MNNPVHSASYELVSLMLESNHKFMDKRNLYREREREKKTHVSCNKDPVSSPKWTREYLVNSYNL
jgi:hypothetical protein